VDNIRILGEYINKKENKKIDFKGIKRHTLYKDNLFTYGSIDYVVSGNREELQNLLITFSSRRPEDYPDKLAKKYTHKKFLKAREKRIEEFKIGDKKYYIVAL